MCAKVLVGDRGTSRALTPDMLSADAIEAINFDQLATPTDRMLLRARHSRRRLSTNKIVYRPSFRVELAEPIAVEPSPAYATRPPAADQTMFIRARSFGTSTTSAAILATVFGIAIALVGLL